TNSIKDSYLGYENRNWVNRYGDISKKNFEAAKKITDEIQKEVNRALAQNVQVPDSVYAGKYQDEWMGEFEILRTNGLLKIRSLRSPRLVGKLLYYKANTFIAMWDDRSFDADAYVMFNLDENAKAKGFTMKAISPLTDFSFDFHHLNFHRKN